MFRHGQKTWPVSRLGSYEQHKTQSENTKGQRQNSYKQHYHSIKSGSPDCYRDQLHLSKGKNTHIHNQEQKMFSRWTCCRTYRQYVCVLMFLCLSFLSGLLSCLCHMSQERESVTFTL